MAENRNKDITSRDVDFALWYTDVITKADLVDYTNVKGSMIIRPYGYAIWENIVSVLDKKIKATGHVNVQMPMFIPESLFNIEKDHVKGFAPEVAWVTHGGSEKLDERMLVRPTSEVLFCEHYKKIIKSYRDLPILYNQWCTIVRWEKTTRPFLRTREILWQEGHTMHATSEEARTETQKMLKVYENLQKNYMAIPTLVGRKTDKEKFAGAEETYACENVMYDGVALQNGTSHYFGNGFAKAFDIKYLDKENNLVTPYQTSWGLSTRTIGAIIMVHGDDFGLVLPPKIAPIKVILIPINNDDKVLTETNKLKALLDQNDISNTIDNSDKTPGFKFANAEVKGYPIRIEIGPRDLGNNEVTLVRRDTLEKETVKLDMLISKVKQLLEDIQSNLYNEALKRRDKMIYQVSTYEEMKAASKNKGLIYTSWCGDATCENKIKEELGLSSRCIPLDDIPSGKCVYCGKEAKHHIYFGKQY